MSWCEATSIQRVGAGVFPTYRPIGHFLSMNMKPSIGDVIAYSSSSSSSSTSTRSLLLGVINEAGNIHRLRQRTGDDNDSITFHENEYEDPLDISDVKIAHVFDEGKVYLTQRIVEDRVSNPHGEHAEDVYILKLSDLRLDKDISDHYTLHYLEDSDGTDGT